MTTSDELVLWAEQALGSFMEAQVFHPVNSYSASQMSTFKNLISLKQFLNMICLNGWPIKLKALTGRMTNWM
jgi:hypothetical protein